MAQLTYFGNRGLAEISRMLMTVGDIQYTEIVLKTRNDYLALVPELQFEQAPLLRIDGMKLVQSAAIARYLARKAHLYGVNDMEAAKIDMLFDGSRDFLRPYVGMVFMPEEKCKAEAKDKALPRYLPAFEKALSENKSGYLVGSKLSLADVGLMECLLATVDYFTDEPFKTYPHIKGFYEMMMKNDKIKKYMKDVRKPKNDEAIVAQVKVTLSHLQF